MANFLFSSFNSFQFGGKAVKNQKYKYGNGVNGCTKLVQSATESG
jgi:hypothetical protein